MKTRTIALILVIAAATFVIGFPNPSDRSLKAETAGYVTRSAVYFPFVCAMGGFDTRISVSGDTTGFSEGEVPTAWVYYYDQYGEIHVYASALTVSIATNSQWAFPLSTLFTTGDVRGSLLILTNVPNAQAAGMISDAGGTGEFAHLRPVIDHSIIDTDAGHIVRQTWAEPPDGTGQLPAWNTLDPDQTLIDPSLHHTTLFFPMVISATGYDTGIALTNFFNATNVADRTATLYLYNKEGALARTIIVDMDEDANHPDPEISPAFIALFSQLATMPFAQLQSAYPGRIISCVEGAGFSSGIQGCMIATINIPYAQGWTFVSSYGGAEPFHDGYAATVDNNIYRVENGTPLRLIAPVLQQTITRVPLVTTTGIGQNGDFTGIFISATTNDSDITAKFYLYDIAGHMVKTWDHVMPTGDALNEPAVVAIYTGNISVNGEGVGFPSGFQMGWMLIKFTAPGVHCVEIIGDLTSNTLCASNCDTLYNIADISTEEGHVGEPIFLNPTPIGTPSDFSLALVTSSGGFDTGLAFFNMRPAQEARAASITQAAFSIGETPANTSNHASAQLTSVNIPESGTLLAPGTVTTYQIEGLSVMIANGDQHSNLADSFVAVVHVYMMSNGSIVGTWATAPGDAQQHINVGAIDLDIDSDNNNGYDTPDRTDGEDQIEGNVPGKIVVINDQDKDGDEIPDYADGFDLNGTGGDADDTNVNEKFVPLVLELPPGIDLDRILILFYYDASDPADVNQQTHTPAPGALRVWKEDGNVARNKNAVNVAEVSDRGDYVPPGVYPPAQLGFGAQGGTITLYVEGIAPITEHPFIYARLYVMCEDIGPDMVRVSTVSPYDLDMDSDNDDVLARSQTEDDVEEVAPGKIIQVNDQDYDNDGIPGFADSFDWDDIPDNDDDLSLSLVIPNFAALDIELPHSVDIDVAQIRFTYDASNPSDVARDPNNVYTPAAGKLRIWAKCPPPLWFDERNKASVAAAPPGDYVPADTFDASKLDFYRGVVRLWVEGIAPSATLGGDSIKVEVDPDGAGAEGFVLIDTVKVTVVRVNLAVDTDRDNSITQLDEKDEESWSKGPNSRGAIILPNCDKDGVGAVAPDNWTGGDWDFDGVDENPNHAVDGNNDKDDIGVLQVPRFGPDDLPDDMVVTLELSQPADEHVYFAAVSAEERVRIFLPTDTDGDDNLVIKEGDEEIMGPTVHAASVTFGTSTGQQDIGIFEGSGFVNFGIEGIQFGAMVDVEMTVKIGTTTIATDVVRVRVAPYVLLDHTCPVDGNGKAVFIEDRGPDNAGLRTALHDKYDDQLLQTAILDHWHQDGYEIGYAKAPYGWLQVILVSPRAYGNNGGLAYHAHTHTAILGPGIGVCWRIEETVGWTSFDSFGNVECRPLSSEPGKWFSGKSLHDDIENFFKAQDVNVAVADDVNTDWLIVGHVDEVVSFCPDGEHTVVADPELCWALLRWAEVLDENALMHEDMNGHAGEMKVKDVLAANSGIGGVTLRDFNLLSSDDQFVMHPDNLPQIRETKLNLPSPETIPDKDGGNTGTGTLSKGGAFVAFFPDNKKRYYRIIFVAANIYIVQYKEEGGEWETDLGIPNNPGDKTKDCVFPNAKCFILSHWWGGGAPALGDQFTFEADPTCKTIEMPLIFGYVDEDPLDPDAMRGAVAYTTGHTNSLVDGDTVITGEAYGPNVNLADYVKAAFEKAYTMVTLADSRYYHNRDGDIHCATNVRRSIPDYNWWEK